ncbi:DUF3833 domain-containing protein [Vibrio sp. Isolate25]|uniref:DUF3833 domain-containing protein n=1 Tax=Vibrio TaxID=662 RepID=UPI001EFE3018|nr:MULTISPECIES: DUF3833 domain-containing protein [Vibrio]MCG9596828.1 DUF3833 domain-containing protein [Vibrio sp. Isolate25]USD33463.1 DUF3833 domain-containing protein [Vibrio sp. SCSIO 43186]USD46532.1 DUF3833 domain-containing protein [Vibrio sp. SCSIO 43145]USD70587.1 DUF3833 domain-containing protein [Vibrio sp. SCSIO 43139]USD95508.1 hypothetical protein CTT30_05060 [Vibrio coralliilyticus]
MRKMKTAIIGVLLTILIGCSTEVSEYKGSTPAFNLFEYFDGEVTAWGMVQDYTNKQQRRFKVDIVGTINGDTITLVEDFVFDDGELDQRIWKIKRLSDSTYEGEAGDILGIAQGKEVGNALHWVYDFELTLDDSKVKVTFDDWLFRQDDRHVFNITSIRKLGVEVGQITLFFQKRTPN